jgi:hypothetical protein
MFWNINAAMRVEATRWDFDRKSIRKRNPDRLPQVSRMSA